MGRLVLADEGSPAAPLKRPRRPRGPPRSPEPCGPEV